MAGGGVGAVGGSVLLQVEAERRKTLTTLHKQLNRIEIALAPVLAANLTPAVDLAPTNPAPTVDLVPVADLIPAVDLAAAVDSVQAVAPALPPNSDSVVSDALATILSLQQSLDRQIAALQTQSATYPAELIALLALKTKLASLLREQTNAVAHAAPYSVILYDLENLIHGNYDSKRSNYISFRKIRERIASHVDLGTICAQKAYANWSNGKLYSLRFATLEEGVQPIQTYGFRDGENQDKSKNLADFHLFDEALRLLETQPHITTFVIASGDGDFIPLITHLKEHGKQVIVCANAGSENPKLVEFCDQLILIRLAEVVEDSTRPGASLNGHTTAPKHDVIRPKRATWSTVNAQLIKQIGPPKAATAEAAGEWIRGLLHSYAVNTQAVELLQRTGQSISAFKILLTEQIPQLDDYIKQVPTRKLKRYLELILADTAFTMVDLEGSIVLALRDQPPAKAKLLDTQTTHSVARTRISLTHPIGARIVSTLTDASPTTDTEVDAAVLALLEAHANHAEIRVELEHKGIELSYLKEMLDHCIPEFERWQKQVFGFSRFGYYLRYLCRDTRFCIATSHGSNSVLLLRSHVPAGCVVLSDRDREPVPSVAVYADFLKLDVPRLLLPKEQTLPQTAQHVLSHAHDWVAFADLETLISRESGQKAAEVRASLHTLVRVGVLETEGSGEIASRSVQLVPVYRDVDTILKMVEAELRQRLAKHLDTVDGKTLRQLLYPAAQVVSL